MAAGAADPPDPPASAGQAVAPEVVPKATLHAGASGASLACARPTEGANRTAPGPGGLLYPHGRPHIDALLREEALAPTPD